MKRLASRWLVLGLALPILTLAGCTGTSLDLILQLALSALIGGLLPGVGEITF